MLNKVNTKSYNTEQLQVFYMTSWNYMSIIFKVASPGLTSVLAMSEAGSSHWQQETLPSAALEVWTEKQKCSRAQNRYCSFLFLVSHQADVTQQGFTEAHSYFDKRYSKNYMFSSSTYWLGAFFEICEHVLDVFEVGCKWCIVERKVPLPGRTAL